MINEVKLKADKWLKEPFDKATQALVQEMKANNEEELIESFYKDLEFGTGGLRGIMGAGTNRINKYTIGQATQGLADYIKESQTGELSTAIAYDSRNNSPYFAQIAADVLSANGIKVYLFDALRPTPELSFAVRYYGCNAGIVITASHNPKEYNGYKVYWNDGGQLVPPHDGNVIKKVQKVSFDAIQFNANPTLIEKIGAVIDAIYLDKISQLSFQNYTNNDLSIVYTALHGTGITLIPQSLAKFGFNNVTVVEKQDIPDGNFPTVASPNPEERAAMTMAIEKAKEIDADVIFGTDPDTDRVGMVVKHNGGFIILNGNQSATILVYYVLQQWKENKRYKGNEFIAKTIVTTSLLDEIATSFGVECVNTLTGFKYIAEAIRENEGKKQFITGGEESYGYLAGDFVRDKDAVISTVLLSEATAWAKANGQTPIDLLKAIYLEFGMYQEHLISITKKGKSGSEEIQQMMEDFRNNPPKQLGGFEVEWIKDYQLNKIKNLLTGEEKETGLPTSNVLQFQLKDGSLVTARPSGTEPKIKFYFSVREALNSKEEYEEMQQNLTAKIEKMAIDLKL